MHAVGADDRVGGGAAAVGEAQRDAGAVAIERHQLGVERNQLRRHGRDQGRVQVAAVHQQVGSAVARLGVCAEGQLRQVRAGVPHPVGPCGRCERAAPQIGLQAECAQDPHRVRAHLNAGAEAHKLSRLLVKPHVGVPPGQQRGQRKSADSGADDGEARSGRHGDSVLT